VPGSGLGRRAFAAIVIAIIALIVARRSRTWSSGSGSTAPTPSST
jgi:hypothetical protein